MATIAPSRMAGSDQKVSKISTGTHPFTCVTCSIAFRSSELQRSHMRTDWHRYNLQRKVASLPPLPAETFTEKVLNAQASKTAAAAKATFSKTCISCERTYYSENAYNNHVGSQKHKARAMAFENGQKTETASVMSSAISLGEPMETSSQAHEQRENLDENIATVSDALKDSSLDKSTVADHPEHPLRSNSDEAPTYPVSLDLNDSKTVKPSGPMTTNRCIFCNFSSPNFSLNVTHMGRFHGMFIPEQDYIVNAEDLISYLQAKVSKNYECLFCHKLKNSLDAIQTHMRDKGHCMIAFEKEEELLEIGQFYDFRSTYSDVSSSEWQSESEEEPPMISSKMAAKFRRSRKLEKDNSDGSDDENEAEDADWETDSETDSDQISSVPVDQVRRRVKRIRRVAPDGFHAPSKQTAYAFENELYLPTGRIAGHRSLNKYWRQNARGFLTSEEKAERKLLTENEDEEAKGTETHLRPLAWYTTRKTDVAAIKSVQNSANLIRSMNNPVVKTRKDRHDFNVARRQNNQKFFRDDNFGIRR